MTSTSAQRTRRASGNIPSWAKPGRGQMSGTAANPSAEIDNLASTAMLAVGNSVVLHIPATPTTAAKTVNATIVSILSATSITISSCSRTKSTVN